jgi:hypothetical protein
MSTAWHFARHPQGMILVQPHGEAHFSEKNNDWDPGEVLVRECIQNSLDARHASDQVSVSFKVRSRALTVEKARFWFGSLWPHLRCKECAIQGIEAEPPAGDFVVVEDFGTRGLEGDVEQFDLSKPDNRFFAFFRAEGLSGNRPDGQTGGSWGIGKSVFNRSSRIRTFLALTARRSEGDVALIGKSLQRCHASPHGDYRGDYQGIGQFGIKASPSDYKVFPGTDEATIQRFVKDFELSRSIEGANRVPGLSVVIPYADPAITAEGIAKIVIREYFHPIIAGRLSVRVSGYFGARQTTVDLDRETIMGHAKDFGPPELTRVLSLAEWSLSDGPKQALQLGAPSAAERPEWSDDLLGLDSPKFKELAEQFSRGERVAVRVPLHVTEKGERPQPASFTVYMQRDLDEVGYKPIYVRGNIVVPNVRKQRSENQFALVVIDEGPLAIMLRAAEPPAHTHWEDETGNCKGWYEYGTPTIDFVVQAPKYLMTALNNAPTDADVDVWADLCPSPLEAGERDAGGRRKKGKTRTPPPIEPPTPRLKQFRTDQVEGGFSVIRANPEQTEWPEALDLQVAYDTSRGNPFKKYHPADFDLSKLEVVATGLEVTRREGNRLRFTPVSDDFKLEVTGFDTNRDLVVKVRTLDAQTEDEGGDE